ncbi:MAG: hypothetical protein HY699_05685 [Deltaproteobacteria bacterium]|nr:hypothetical protein [Deltaproteobacteria bacterium]
MASETARTIDDGSAMVTGHRSRELQWRRTHAHVLRALAGQWVVVEGEELVAHGPNAVRVVAESRQKGVETPYLFFVEPDDAGDVVRIGL